MFCRSCGAPWTPGSARCPECGELHAEATTRSTGPELEGERHAEFPTAPVERPVAGPAHHPADPASPGDGLLPGSPARDEEVPAEDLLRQYGPWLLAGALALFVIGAAVLTIAFFGSGTATVAAEPSATPIELPPTSFPPASGMPSIPAPASTRSMSGLATPDAMVPSRRPGTGSTSTRQSDRLVTPTSRATAGAVGRVLAADVNKWVRLSTAARADIRAAIGRISCGRDNTEAGRMITDVISQRQAIERAARTARREQPAGAAGALLRAMERAQQESVRANQAYLAATTDPDQCRGHLADGDRISTDDVTPVKNAFLALWRPWADQYDYDPGDRDFI